jgi:hypothetical protein
MSGGMATVERSWALLDPDTPRSDRDPEAAAAVPDDCFARHPITGAFTKPAVESAFSVGAFRDAFPLHAVLLAVAVVVQLNLARQTLHAIAVMPSGSPNARNVVLSLSIICIIGLVGRVRLHCMQDLQVRSQRLGSALWTASVVLVFVVGANYNVNVIVSAYVTRSGRTCTAMRTQHLQSPILYLIFALVNGSHGMGFLHKTALLVLVLISDLMMRVVCDELALALSSAGALVVGYVAAHLAELHMRRAFAEKRHLVEEKRRDQERREQAEERQEQAETRQEQLQTAMERLQYDFNMVTSSYRLTPADDNRSELRRDLQPSGAAGPSGLPPPRPPSSPGRSISSYSSDGYWDRCPSQLVLRNDPTERAEHRERELLRDAQRCGPKVWAVIQLLFLGMSQEGSSPFQVLDIELVRQIIYHIIVTRLSFVRSSEVALVPGSPWHAMIEWVRPTLLLQPPVRVPPAAWTPMLPDDSVFPGFPHPSPPPQTAAPRSHPLPAVEARPPPAADEEEQGEDSEEEDDDEQVPGPPGAVVPLFLRGGRGRGRGRGGQRGERGGHDEDGVGPQE